MGSNLAKVTCKLRPEPIPELRLLPSIASTQCFIPLIQHRVQRPGQPPSQEARLTLEVFDLEEILTSTHILSDLAWGWGRPVVVGGSGSFWDVGGVFSRELKSRIAAWLLKQHNIIKSVMEPRP